MPRLAPVIKTVLLATFIPFVTGEVRPERPARTRRVIHLDVCRRLLKESGQIGFPLSARVTGNTEVDSHKITFG